MSYVNPFEVHYRISYEWAEQMQHVQDYVERLMIHYAHEHGLVMFNPKTIRFEVTYESGVEEGVMHASWHPTGAAEFSGGPHDGRVVNVPDVSTLRLATANPVTMPEDPSRPETWMGFTETIYRRAGINPETNRWVYTPKG